MIYLRAHAVNRVRERFNQYAETVEADIRYMVIETIYSSHDVRRNRYKNDVLAFILEDIVIIGKEEGKDITVVTVLKYSVKSKSWFNTRRCYEKERDYV